MDRCEMITQEQIDSRDAYIKWLTALVDAVKPSALETTYTKKHKQAIDDADTAASSSISLAEQQQLILKELRQGKDAMICSLVTLYETYADTECSSCIPEGSGRDTCRGEYPCVCEDLRILIEAATGKPILEAIDSN